ncbi:MAG: hypothetical protein ACW96N_01500 [Candidatus Thorarchaeota archaeon]
MSRKSIYQIDNVPDEEGWKSIREDLVNLSGINRIPRIYVEESHRNGDLTLRHEHDGRDLELDYADQVVRHISSLWEGAVRLFTIIEDDEFEI